MRSMISLAIFLVATASPVSSQCSITTTFAGGTGQAGDMFDVVALNDVTLTGLDLNLLAGTWDLEVYACLFGSYVGHANDPSVWILVGSASGVVSSGANTPTPLGASLSVPINAGQTQGLYVTVVQNNAILHTVGTSAGLPVVEDSNIRILEGLSRAYPFAWSFGPRIWNGNLYYSGGAGGYQVNQYASTLTVNGAPEPGPCTAMSTTFQSGTAFSLDSASILSGNPYQLGVTVGVGVVNPANGGYLLPDGQILNLDSSALQLIYSPPLPVVTGATSLQVTAPPVTTPTVFALQQVVVDPAQSTLLSFSRAVEINVTPFPKMRIDAVGYSSQSPSTSSGFWRVTHFGSIAPFPADAITSVTFDFAASSDPDIAARFFDTDQAYMADRFDGGNSILPGCSGTYRNNCDVLRGLDYSATLTSPCDPLALTGWAASNPGVLPGDWQTITFPFVPGAFSFGIFAFDADTDGPGIHSGRGQQGTVVTVVTQGPGGTTTYTGALSYDPADPSRSTLFIY